MTPQQPTRKSTVLTPETMEVAMKNIDRVLGYARCSTPEQSDSGAGIEAQKGLIEQECCRRGWPSPGFVVDEGSSGATLDRPGLAKLIEEVNEGRVDVVVVAKLDRLSRSVVDFATLLNWFSENTECELLVLDLAIDTSTPGGELVANVVAAVAQWERKIIAARTKDGLAAIRRRGGSISRPAVADHPDLHRRIQALRDEGMTLQGIADLLNGEGVKTLRGGREWRPNAIATCLGYRRRPGAPKQALLPKKAKSKSSARKGGR